MFFDLVSRFGLQSSLGETEACLRKLLEGELVQRLKEVLEAEREQAD